MIGSIRMYFEKKNKFELFLLREGNFKNAKKRYVLDSRRTAYPILANENCFTYKVDKYRGYIYGSLFSYYFSKFGGDFESGVDFTYKEMCYAIDAFCRETVDIEKSKMTTVSIVFTVTMKFQAEGFIRRNLLMYNYKGYNHNKKTSLKEELKYFDYEDFEILFSADRTKDDLKQNKLKVEIRIKESETLEKTGVNSILDLKDKEALEKLFNLFLIKYDGLTIIDSFENLDNLKEKDKLKMPLYMNVDYWKELPKIKNRQAKHRARKDFERIQSEYLLNNLKKELRESLISAFNQFINN
jgi:hypothetical protein